MNKFGKWMDTHAEAIRWSGIGFFTANFLNDVSVKNYTGATIDAVLVLINLFPFRGQR